MLSCVIIDEYIDDGGTFVRLKIVVSHAQKPETKFEFRSAYCLVGRKNATLTIDDSLCSQQHLLLFQGPDGRLWVRDLDSTNGTYVNEVKFVEKALNVGDSVRVGRTTITISSFSPSKEGSITEARSLGEDEEADEPTFIGKKKSHKVDPELVVHRWPDNLKASPRNVQEKFIDYVDERGEKNRVRLKDLLKAA